MRLVFVSDTHGMHGRMLHPVPDGDVLIHCGDLTGHGALREIAAVAKWLGDQPHVHKLAIAGNHDAACENDPGVVAMFFRECGVNYLRDNAMTIGGVLFYGAPWTPNFYDWHFMPPRHSPELKAKWDMIPDDTQVLITHGPPHGILDETCTRYQQAGAQDHAGCELLRARVEQLSKLKVHAFGHIHEGYGTQHGYTAAPVDLPGLKFVNAAICNRDYEPVNRPIVVDI